MRVDITRNLKLSKLDHLFVLLPQNGRPNLPEAIAAIADDVAKRSRFEGRSDESITVLSDQPRKVTLIGIGKEPTIRAMKTALASVAKTAQKQRDKRIAVAVGSTVDGASAESSTRLLASLLAHADYKYDTYKTDKKDDAKPPAVDAQLVAFDGIDKKRLRAIEDEANAISVGVRTVRDLGNAPANLMTPTRLANRAVEVAREVGVKCTVYERRDIERMKMGGLIAVNRGSVEEPRFVVMEYSPRRAKKHVALVGKGITFDSGGISIKPAE